MRVNNSSNDSLKDKFQNEKSFSRTSKLDHAAGDYEPLQDNSNEEHSNIRGLFSKKQNRDEIDEQLNQDERLEVEALKRENEIDNMRADYGSTDPDRN